MLCTFYAPHCATNIAAERCLPTCSEQDIAILPYGLETEIGEKVSKIPHYGLSNSSLKHVVALLPKGNQLEWRAEGSVIGSGCRFRRSLPFADFDCRVCLARAVYFDAEIILLDDPLSAVRPFPLVSSPLNPN